jgi:hypothetical protein
MLRPSCEVTDFNVVMIRCVRLLLRKKFPHFLLRHATCPNYFSPWFLLSAFRFTTLL